MVFLYFVELFIQLAVIVFVGTQMIWPAVCGGKWFPLFRRKELEEERRQAEEEVDRAILEAKIDELHKTAERVKQKTDHPGQQDSPMDSPEEKE